MLWLWMTAHALAADLNVDVGDDWCATLAAAEAGDRVLLAPGTHQGLCAVTPNGEPGNPVILTTQDSERRAVLTATDASANLLDLYGGHLVIEGLNFGPTSVNVEAIRLHAGEQVTVRDCDFAGIGGASIIANTAGSTYAELTIEDNRFSAVVGSAITVGCFAGGTDCAATDVVVRRNRIDGVASGSGIVLEVDSVGQISHNSVSGTVGPTVRVGGDAADGGGVEAPAEGALPSTVVERNHLSGSGDSAALVVDGGPVLVRNNIVLSGSQGALRAADATGTGRMDHIHILGNALVGGDGPAVALTDWPETASSSFEVNGIWDPNAPGAGLPAAVGALPWSGNVDCSSETACFEDITNGDPSPRGGGELVGAGTEVATGWLAADFCGSPRSGGGPAGPLTSSLESPLSLSSDTDPTIHCAESGPDDSGTDSGIDSGGRRPRPGTWGDGSVGSIDTGDGPPLPAWSAAWKAGETGGVSCASAGIAASWSTVLLGLFAAARRRQT